MQALGSGLILFILIVAVGFFAIPIFPIAAIVSWKMRKLVDSRPILGGFFAVSVGAIIGALFTANDLRVGPGDNWSGALVGMTFSFTYFVVVKVWW